VVYLATTQTLRITHAGGFGTTFISLRSESLEGNYDGAVLNNAISVVSLTGFTAFTKLQGVRTMQPIKQILPSDRTLVQAQPTSNLGRLEFLVRPDVPVTADTEIEVLSSNSAVVSAEALEGGRVLFRSGEASFKTVVATHGGTFGSAVLSFRAYAPAGSNYVNIESGYVGVEAMPGLVFSRTLVDVQLGGTGTFTIAPDTLPTRDVFVTITTSDPSVATVQASVNFTAADGISAKNSRTVTITYVSEGTVALSFRTYSPGGNFDGVIWSNGVVAACRPGFLVSVKRLLIPYDGSATFTLTPTTVPTVDTAVTIVSSQPAKAAATTPTVTFRAGQKETLSVVIKSWCSVSPSNCARAGETVISFHASAPGGNYDGVDATSNIRAQVQAPLLIVSHTSLLVQASARTATLSVAPSVPPTVRTFVMLDTLDPSVATVQQSLVFEAGSLLARDVIVTWVSVGLTQLRVTVPTTGSAETDSNYVDMDPVLVQVCTRVDLIWFFFFSCVHACLSCALVCCCALRDFEMCICIRVLSCCGCVCPMNLDDPLFARVCCTLTSHHMNV
jgi:hypothetical protein